MSPKKKDIEEQSDMTSDFLTGDELDSICDVTMQDKPTYDDMFIDVDYLVSRTGSNHSNKVRKSVLVTFDPLYEKELERSVSVHTGSVADSAEGDGGYETGSATSVLTDVAPLTNSVSTGAMHTTSFRESPTRIVPPVVNSEVLILRKQDQEILNLRQEIRELKSLLQDCQHKHTREIDDLESKMKKSTEEKDDLLVRVKINKLLFQINEKNLNNKQMEEYEKTISSLIGEQHREKRIATESIDKLTYERDQALNHLASMESSFNDLLSKHEKCKLEAKEREKIYEQKLEKYKAEVKKYESLYNTLKETLENCKKNHNVKITKLNALIKNIRSSMQESLDRKIRDIEELTNDVR